MKAELIVIGGGMVGSAIGYGLANQGTDVLVLDGNDRDPRASTANFGLVWLHGKGIDMPSYYMLSRDSVRQWTEFSAELFDATSIDVQFENRGGLVPCLGESEFTQRNTTLTLLHNQLGGLDPEWEMLDRQTLQGLFPKIELGPDVTGASLGHLDGHANPLRLLTALQSGIERKGGRVRGGCIVKSIKLEPGGGCTLDFGHGRASAERIVIAAGLGSKALAAQVGVDVPIRPERGQLLVTERLEPIFPLPMLGLRQTREGTVMIGVTNEETGLDASTTTAAAAQMSADAVRTFPMLAGATLVRQWAGLRILTPDGFPIYAESASHPGAFVALCHSGVTLAAVHATALAQAVVKGRLPRSLDVFHPRRFDVPQAA